MSTPPGWSLNTKANVSNLALLALKFTVGFSWLMAASEEDHNQAMDYWEFRSARNEAVDRYEDAIINEAKRTTTRSAEMIQCFWRSYNNNYYNKQRMATNTVNILHS
jgi:hypothetical protein